MCELISDLLCSHSGGFFHMKTHWSCSLFIDSHPPYFIQYIIPILCSVLLVNEFAFSDIQTSSPYLVCVFVLSIMFVTFKTCILFYYFLCVYACVPECTHVCVGAHRGQMESLRPLRYRPM